MKRREAREYTFKLIYELGVQDDKSAEELIEHTAEAQEFEPDKYIKKTVRGVSEHKEEIDALIADCAVNWNFNRLSATSLAIMRLASYEMLFSEDVPFSIAINEAVELAKKYDHDKAPKFINGILNAIAVKKGLKGEVKSEEPAQADDKKSE
jgi:N utilization substance protein B